MATDTVLNAAKAIYESRNGAGCRPWSQLPAIAKAAYLDDAEAARKSFLAALQEPTEGMYEAVNALTANDKLDADFDWRASLAASALGEQSE